MKRGTIEHPKTRRLSNALDIPTYSAVGILESLWHTTAKYARRGDIGKFSNEDISAALDWRGEPDELVSGLLKAGWLDESDEHRLLVHDWHEHSEDTVKKTLKNRGETFFTCGTVPENSGKEEKSSACHSHKPIANSQEPMPEPSPTPTRHPASADEDDVEAFDQPFITTQGDYWLPGSDYKELKADFPDVDVDHELYEFSVRLKTGEPLKNPLAAIRDRMRRPKAKRREDSDNPKLGRWDKDATPDDKTTSNGRGVCTFFDSPFPTDNGLEYVSNVFYDRLDSNYPELDICDALHLALNRAEEIKIKDPIRNLEAFLLKFMDLEKEKKLKNNQRNRGKTVEQCGTMNDSKWNEDRQSFASVEVN